MANENTKSSINGPHRYGAETVSYSIPSISLRVCAVDAAVSLPFAHVLNCPVSEEIWPGDAAQLFFGKYFAMRLVGDDEVYRRQGLVWDHMREEILRQCDHTGSRTLESIWLSNHMVDCYISYGSFAGELFMEEISQSLPIDNNWDDPFGDGSDDDHDEPDTLNSELLLTEEYLGPAPSKGELTPDCSEFEQNADSPTLNPKRRVFTIKPTEH